MDAQTGIPLLIVAAIVGSALNVFAIFYRHTQTDRQFCALDSSIVQIFQKTLANVPPAQATKHPAEYEKFRFQYTGYINKFADLAPCHIDRHVPPDPLAR